MAIQKAPSLPLRLTTSGSGLIDLRGLKILVVDDDPDGLFLIETLLEGAHARVVTADTAASALRALRSTRPDVIVSDIDMPDGDGYQLMRMIRSRTADEGGWTPAIALTGHAGTLDHTRALLAGFQVHLAKPIGAAELLITIRSVAAAARSPS